MEYLDEFVLDLHEIGYWMARYSRETFPIGRDKARAINIIDQLNKAHRPNLELRDGTLYVCWNNHEKAEPCDYEVLVENAL